MFAKKIFRVLGSPPPDPLRPSGDEGVHINHETLFHNVSCSSQTPFPLLWISSHAPDTERVMLILQSFRILQ